MQNALHQPHRRASLPKWKWLLCAAAAGSACLAAAAWRASSAGSPPTTTASATSFSPATQPVWLTDFRLALAEAGNCNKDLLVEFTSRQPDQPAAPDPLAAPFEAPAFAAAATGRFILVRLDVNSSSSDPAAVARTAEWIDRLNLTELPRVVAFDARSRPFGTLSPRDVADKAGGAGWTARFDRLLADKASRDRAFAAADEAGGAARAKLLDQALERVPTVAAAYTDVAEEIVRLDADDAAGLKAKYAARFSEQMVDAGIQHLVYPLIDAGDLRGALEQADRLDRRVATSVPQHQLLRAFQAQLYSGLGDKARAVALMDQAIALDPASEAAGRVRSEKLKLQE